MAQTDREAKLAKALRDNLRRRKTPGSAREPEAPEPPPGPGAPTPPSSE